MSVETLTTVAAHRAACLDLVRPLPPLDLALRDALGCVLAEDVVSPRPLPAFDNSGMDGYAVRLRDVAGATEGAVDPQGECVDDAKIDHELSIHEQLDQDGAQQRVVGRLYGDPRRQAQARAQVWGDEAERVDLGRTRQQDRAGPLARTVQQVEQGCLVALRERALSDHELRLETKDGEQVVQTREDPVAREDRAFVDALQGAAERVLVPYEEGLRTQATVWAADLSAREGGRPVDVAELLAGARNG